MESDALTPKIVVFLGSGASAFAGYHTFATFPDLIYDQTVRSQDGLPPLHSTTISLLEEIKDTLRKAAKPTTHDNYLWALTDYKRLWLTLRVDGVLQTRFLTSTNLWGQFAYFAQTTEDATNDITLTTLKHYSTNRVLEAQQREEFSFDAMRRVHMLYTILASINNSEIPFLPVFTTNYDMLIEDLFSTFGNTDPHALPLITGIPSNSTEGSTWSSTQYFQTGLRPHGLYLYRIHGCVCWFYHSFGDENVYFHRRDCMQQNPNMLCAMYPGQESLPGVNPHGFGYRQFHEMLLSCECVVFIGFSFRDDDIMHLVLSANSQRETPLNVIVLDPSIRETDVIANLEASSKRTPYPAKTLDVNKIKSIDARFGHSDFDTRLLEVLNQIIQKGD